jgi:hypothetical protein
MAEVKDKGDLIKIQGSLYIRSMVVDDSRRPTALIVHPYLAAAMMGLTIVLASWLIHRPTTSNVGRAAAAAVPLPFALALFRALMRYVRGLDELEQRKQLEALAYALGATTITALTVGLLQTARLLPYWGWHGVWIVTIPAYLVGNFLAGRRYR